MLQASRRDENQMCRWLPRLLDLRVLKTSPHPMRRLLFLFSLLAAFARAEIPEPFNTEAAKTAPMPAAEAAAKMQLPDGFRATVFAAEPDVRQPIGMALDARGRLWVVSATPMPRPVRATRCSSATGW